MDQRNCYRSDESVSERCCAWALETPMSSLRHCDGLMVSLCESCSADADDLFSLPRLMHLFFSPSFANIPGSLGRWYDRHWSDPPSQTAARLRVGFSADSLANCCAWLNGSWATCVPSVFAGILFQGILCGMQGSVWLPGSLQPAMLTP